MNVLFDKAVLDTELDFVRVAESIVVVFKATEVFELVNIDAEVGR